MSISPGGSSRLGAWLAGLLVLAACAGPTAVPPAASAPRPLPVFTSAAGVPPARSTPTPTPTPVPTAAPAAACRAGWGSTAKAVPELGPAPLVAVRTGADRCVDRIEFEVDGPAAGYSVSYVDEVVQDGSGTVLAVPGGARLQVRLNHPAYDDAGRATLPGRAGEPLPSVSGYRSLRSVVFAGSFEGYTVYGVGVRARLPFRTSVADGSAARSRIVVELAHSWS